MATNRIIALARSAALRSTWHWKVGAVIYKGSKVLSTGTNDWMKTSPKSFHEFKSRHAEFNALIKVRNEDRKGASIFVFRIGRDGLTHNAKPCGACEKMLAWAEIKRIDWSIDQEYVESIIRQWGLMTSTRQP